MALIFDAFHLLDLVSLVRASCIACQEQEVSRPGGPDFEDHQILYLRYSIFDTLCLLLICAAGRWPVAT